MALISQRSLHISGLDLARDKIFLHAIEHVQICTTRHLLSVDFVCGLSKAGIKLGQPFLVVSNRHLNLGLLDFETGDLLPDSVVLVLLESNRLFGVVVLLLDLRQLDGDFVDLFLLVLVGRRNIGRLEEGVHLDEAVVAVVHLELFLHDRAAHALQLRGTVPATGTVSVHSSSVFMI